jgi:hypothetical protein
MAMTATLMLLAQRGLEEGDFSDGPSRALPAMRSLEAIPRHA